MSEGQLRCSSLKECGSDDDSRYKGLCDKDGCDFTPFRMGNPTLYGPGSRYFTIDTARKFTIVTRFLTRDNTTTWDLLEIRRLFKQDNRIVDTPNSMWPGLNDVNSFTDSMCNTSNKLFGDQNDHATKGGLVRMGEHMANDLTLAMTLWSDHAAYCLGRGSSYLAEADSTKPGVKLGSCPTRYSSC